MSSLYYNILFNSYSSSVLVESMAFVKMSPKQKGMYSVNIILWDTQQM